MNIITIHSFKGGTGKTSIAVNIAILLAKQGKNVCLLDLDYSGPSLGIIFDEKVRPFWLNDFLDEQCGVDDFLVDVTSRANTPGKLFCGFANPATQAIRAIIIKDKHWQMNALSQLIRLRKALAKPPFNCEYIILDTSPGVHYPSVNAIVASDVVVLVVKLDISDFMGTNEMIKGIHTSLRKETYLLVNRVPPDMVATPEGTRELQEILMENFREAIETGVVRILGWIPCFCDVSMKMGKIIWAVERPDHLFVKSLESFLPVLTEKNTEE